MSASPSLSESRQQYRKASPSREQYNSIRTVKTLPVESSTVTVSGALSESPTV